MPNANEPRALWPILLIVIALAAGGCSTSTTNSGLSLVDEQGNHPDNFLATHPGFALSSVSQCTTCHGDDLKGGIANTSCFNAACHHGTVPGWVAVPPAAQAHGASAKKAPGNSGFVSCRICHGDTFSGGGAQVSCLNNGASCHGAGVLSPHPGQWLSGGTYFHMTTDEANAPVCAQCHRNGNNSPIAPPSPTAPAGTPPGCFNNTLCHGENPVPHPLDNTWVATPPAAQPHGNSAKAVPSSSSGFAYCRICHGTSTGNYNGGIAQVSCLNNSACHGSGVQSPHASQWFQGDTYKHITTDEGNASECAFCHYNEPGAGAHTPISPPGGVTVGCFNNTLCHGASASFHPAGWFVRSPGPQLHGQSAKAAPSGSSGFAYCRVCHGTSTGSYDGGVVQFSCLIVACHGGTGNSPHAAQWLPDDTYMHTTTDPGNAPECAFCHYGESGGGNHPPTPPPAGSTPGCTNNTLCHGT
jgi:hypothetical protein